MKILNILYSVTRKISDQMNDYIANAECLSELCNEVLYIFRFHYSNYTYNKRIHNCSHSPSKIRAILHERREI